MKQRIRATIKFLSCLRRSARSQAKRSEQSNGQSFFLVLRLPTTARTPWLFSNRIVRSVSGLNSLGSRYRYRKVLSRSSTSVRAWWCSSHCFAEYRVKPNRFGKRKLWISISGRRKKIRKRNHHLRLVKVPTSWFCWVVPLVSLMYAVKLVLL
jgi:hypothetical protein